MEFISKTLIEYLHGVYKNTCTTNSVAFIATTIITGIFSVFIFIISLMDKLMRLGLSFHDAMYETTTNILVFIFSVFVIYVFVVALIFIPYCILQYVRHKKETGK